MLVQQLLSPKRVFSKDENGNEVFVDKPPTSLEVQAARRIQELEGLCQRLSQTCQQLQQQLAGDNN